MECELLSKCGFVKSIWIAGKRHAGVLSRFIAAAAKCTNANGRNSAKPRACLHQITCCLMASQFPFSQS